MARYFFDLLDGVRVDRDETGIECQDIADARAAAADALGDLTREALPDGSRIHFIMKVRDPSDRYVHQCAINFTADDIET